MLGDGLSVSSEGNKPKTTVIASGSDRRCIVTGMFIQQLFIYLLSAYYMPSTVLAAWDMSVNKTETPALKELTLQLGKNRQTINKINK